MHMTSGNRAELSPLTNSAVKYEKTSQRRRRADKLCKAGVGSCFHARVALAAQRPAVYNTHEYATVACIGWSCSRRQPLLRRAIRKRYVVCYIPLPAL